MSQNFAVTGSPHTREDNTENATVKEQLTVLHLSILEHFVPSRDKFSRKQLGVPVSRTELPYILKKLFLTTMRTFILLFLSLIALALAFNVPTAPELPKRFLAVGSFLSLNKDGSFKGYGKFNMKYDWENQVVRTDATIYPESHYDMTYLVAWNTVSDIE